MKHDHSKFQKKVGIRKFQRNVYDTLPKKDESILITNHGQAMYSVSAVFNGDNNENNS